MKKFKLIVKTSPNCIELCRYLNKNIESVNEMGVQVHVEKIASNEFDEETVTALKNKGITRLPTLITPDGKLFIGLKNITDLFEKNLTQLRRNSRIGVGGAMSNGMSGGYGGPATGVEIGTNPDMSAFWAREMYAGVGKDGKPLARTDKDEPDDDGTGDMQKRIIDYQRNVPAHRRPGGRRELDVDPPQRNRGGGRRPAEEYVSPDDNIGGDEGYDDTPAVRPRVPKLERSGDSRADDLDQRMLAAWLDNNTTEQ